MITRELNRRLIYECRFDDRLKAKDEGSTRLVYTLSQFVYYETIHREVPNRRRIYECRCDERLKSQYTEGSTG